MTFIPTPRVYLDGVLVATALREDGTPDPGAPLVIEDTSADWGREQYLDDPDTPVGRLSLFLPDRAWLTPERDAALVGMPVALSWVNPDTAFERFYFRGRIAKPYLSRQRVVIANEKVDGLRLECELASDFTELANILCSFTAPEENSTELASRLIALSNGVVTGAFLNPALSARTFIPRSVVEEPLLELFIQLFAAQGDRMVWDPHFRRVGFSNRMWWDQPNILRLVANIARGVTLRPIAPATVAPWPSWTASGLDARALADLDAPLERDLSSALTRVQVVSHRPSDSPEVDGSTDRFYTALVPGVDEARNGIRSYRHDGWWYSVSSNEEAGRSIAEVAAREAKTWRLPPITLDTKRSGGGFEDATTAGLFLNGTESPALFVIHGSWLPTVGVRPVFGAIGGTITYQAGRWVSSLNTQHIALGQPQTQLRWSEMATTPAALNWTRGTAQSLDPAITWADLGWVGRGLGATADAPRP